MRPHRSIVALVPLAFGLLACGEPATPEGPVAKSVGSAAPTPAMPALPTPDSPPPAGDGAPVKGRALKGGDTA